MNNKNKKEGFTLIELLVSIAIFAVLSAMGWKVFDYLIKVKDRNSMHEENLGQLQQAYQQVQRDSLQMMPITANLAGQIQPALVLNNNNLTFSKVGVTDPLKQGLSPYERVEYQYNAQDKKIYRLKYNNLNMNNAAQPLSSVILADVDQYEIVVLTPNELNRWPEGANSNDVGAQSVLPRGIKMRFTIRGIEYEWIFSLLNTDYLVRLNRQNNVNDSGNVDGNNNANVSSQNNNDMSN